MNLISYHCRRFSNRLLATLTCCDVIRELIRLIQVNSIDISEPRRFPSAKLSMILSFNRVNVLSIRRDIPSFNLTLLVVETSHVTTRLRDSVELRQTDRLQSQRQTTTLEANYLNLHISFSRLLADASLRQTIHPFPRYSTIVPAFLQNSSIEHSGFPSVWLSS